MKEQIKDSVKCVLDDFCLAKDDEIMNDCLYGFIISEFVLQKETIIKKIQYPKEKERIVFNYSENYGALLAIRELADCIRNGLKSPEESNFDVSIYTNENDVFIDSADLKKDIAIVHNFRNMLAHGFFEINGDCIETSSTEMINKVECVVDIASLERFNESIVSANISPLNCGYIVECFDGIERYKIENGLSLGDAIKELVDKSLWAFAYMNAFFSLNDKLEYSNFDTSYFELISGNYNYQNFMKKRYEDFASKGKAKNDCLEHYHKCSSEAGKLRISEKAASKKYSINSDDTNFMKEIFGKQFRNAIMHGNMCLLYTGDILLFDTNNQYNHGKINKYFVISLENFVSLIKNSKENLVDVYKIEAKKYLSRAINNLENFNRLSVGFMDNGLSLWDIANVSREVYFGIISDLYFIKESDDFDIENNQRLLMDDIEDVWQFIVGVQKDMFIYMILNSGDETLVEQYLLEEELDNDRVMFAIQNSVLFEIYLELDRFIQNYIKWLDYCYIVSINNFELSINDDVFIEEKEKYNDKLSDWINEFRQLSETFDVDTVCEIIGNSEENSKCKTYN